MGASTHLEAKRIGFLHTAQVHVDTFEALAQARELQTEHRVREHWLADAISNGLNNDLQDKVVSELTDLAEHCAVVICTCSTLGALADFVPDARVFRVDAPMMHSAAASSGTTLLAYCLDSTRATSTRLLESAFAAAGKPTNYRLLHCAEAWPLFEQGKTEAFGASIASCVNSALDDLGCGNVSAIVLAQASMTAALKPLAGNSIPVYTSPASAVDYALTLLD